MDASDRNNPAFAPCSATAIVIDSDEAALGGVTGAASFQSECPFLQEAAWAVSVEAATNTAADRVLADNPAAAAILENIADRDIGDNIHRKTGPFATAEAAGNGVDAESIWIRTQSLKTQHPAEWTE